MEKDIIIFIIIIYFILVYRRLSPRIDLVKSSKRCSVLLWYYDLSEDYNRTYIKLFEI